jgi:hypothetical protein
MMPQRAGTATSKEVLQSISKNGLSNYQARKAKTDL